MCSPSFVRMPKYTDETQPSNVYPLDWSRLAGRIKAERNYTCEDCACKKDGKSELHLHHIDGNKFNNTPVNLKVLCWKCHTKYHSHMRKKRDLVKTPVKKGVQCPNPKCQHILNLPAVPGRYRCPKCNTKFRNYPT